MSACPIGACNGFGILDSGELCPSYHEADAEPTVSPLEAAWAEADRLADASSAAHLAVREATERSRVTWCAFLAGINAAEAIGPRPAKVPTCCDFHATGGHPADRHGLDSADKVYGGPPPCDGQATT